MHKKINISIYIVIIFSIFLLSTSAYIDLKHEEKLHNNLIIKQEQTTREHYKIILKESVDTTITVIDSIDKTIIQNHRKLLKIEISNIFKYLNNKKQENIYQFLKTYQHEFIEISTKELDNEVQDNFLLNGQRFYIAIKDNRIKNILIEAVRNFLYSNIQEKHRYTWIHKVIDFSGGENYAIRLIHPNLKEKENEYLSTYTKDIKGNLPYLEELNAIKQNKDIYFEYYFKELNADKISAKLSYSKLYKKYNWIVATGIPIIKLTEYKNQDIKIYEEKYKEHYFKKIYYYSTVIILFIIILLLMKNLINKTFKANQKLKEELANKLEQIESNYKELFYKNKSIILIIDPVSGKILDANKVALGFYKYSLEQLKSLNINNINTLSPIEMKKEINLALKEERDHFLFKHIISTGEIIPVKVFSTPTEYQGHIALYSIIQNVEEEYNVKEDLNETIKKLKKIQDNLDSAQKISHIGSWEYDNQTNKLFCSKETYDILNINEKDEIKYYTFINIIHPDDKGLLKKSVLKKQLYNSKQRLVFNDGTIKFIENQSEHIFNAEGKYVKTLGIIQDVTQLTTIENKANKFFDLSINILLIADFDTNIIQVNKGWENILGYTENELLNKKFIDFIHPDDVDITLKEIKKLSKGEQTFYFENRYIHKNGSIRILSWSATSVPENNILYASAQDITEMREKTSLLFQQSKMAAIGEMLANIAHQWRQPLSIISTISSGVIIQKELDTLDDKYLVNSMNKITESTLYLSNTIEDFRGFFKPNKEETICSSKNIINKTLKILEAQFKNKNINIIINVDDVEFFTYENELLQVLINILNNSKDQLNKTDIEEKLIFINSYEKDNQLLISIRDNGKGINQKIINKVFEPYFTTKDKSVGTGIGLYMCEEIIVKHMQGNITVENKEFTYQGSRYKGAEFTILLQIKKEEN